MKDLKQYVTIETAMLLREKGYSSGSNTHYCMFHKDYIYSEDESHPKSYKKGEFRVYEDWFIKNEFLIESDSSYYTLCERPTQSEVQNWLKNNFQVKPFARSITKCKPNEECVWGFDVILIHYDKDLKHLKTVEIDYFDESYEKVVEYAIQSILKNIKQSYDF